VGCLLFFFFFFFCPPHGLEKRREEGEEVRTVFRNVKDENLRGLAHLRVGNVEQDAVTHGKADRAHRRLVVVGEELGAVLDVPQLGAAVG